MADNIQYLNAVRGVASQGYQDRIPEATQTNLSEVVTAIMDYPTNKNEFIDVLTNRVAQTKFMSKLYNNPYKHFKKGTLPYGDSIESIFVDIIKGKSFDENFGDSEVSSLIGKEAVDNVKVEYYTENFKNKYKITLSDIELRKAFMSADGLQNLINRLMIAPLNSAEYDEFLITKKLLNTVSIGEMVIPGYATASDDNGKAKQLTKCVKTQVAKMGFLSNAYNGQGVMTYSKPNEMVIFVTPETKAMLDVELLASAFNMEKAEMSGRIVLIDEFDADNIVCIVADEQLIQMYDTLNQTESFRNADKLITNTFLHKWGVAYGCSFANALKLVSTATA